MKHAHLLLLTTLLSQTTPIWAMQKDDFPANGAQHRPGPTAGQSPRENSREYSFELIGDTIRPISGTQARFRITPVNGGSFREAELMVSDVRHLRFEAEMPAGLVFHPNIPLPQDLVRVRERILCKFEYNGLQSCETTILTPYLPKEDWTEKEDRDRQRDVYTLRLNTLDENQVLHDVYHETTPYEIPHTYVRDIGEERQGERYYDGNTVYLGRIKPQIWKNKSGQEYNTEIVSRNLDLPNHIGNDIIHVEPFSLGNDLRSDYRGVYGGPVSDLAEYQMLAGREPGRLIYSDGRNIFLPHLTQERWERDQVRVGFFIASYNKKNNRLHFRDKARFRNNNRFEQGIYQLASVEERDGRLEKWLRLGENPYSVEIFVEGGEASIPGMGAYAPHIISQNNMSPEIIDLKKDMSEVSRKLFDIDQVFREHPHAEGSVFILGPSGSGKSVLAHLLAQRSLEGRRVRARGIRLDTDNSLPGFSIGHRARAGTVFPAVWYDEPYKRFVVDVPGFGDPAGATVDILNAFSIHHLLVNRNKIKIVMTAREDEINRRSNHFIKLLNDITGFFQNDEDLYHNLSFVITHQRNTQPDEFSELLEDALEDLPRLPLRSRALLTFLANHPNRISSIPEPLHEGSFNFNVQDLENTLGRAIYLQPTVRMEIGNEARLLVGDLGQSLNDYLTNYMGTEGAQRIINFCRDRKINIHNGSVGQLRASLSNVIRDLRVFQQIPANEPERFVNDLKRFINVDDIERIISQISFLKSIGENVVYQISSWTNALLPTMEKIQSLTIPPTVEMHGDELYLKASFLGTSDIQEAITRHPDLPVRAYAWNTIFFDANITNYGKSFVAIAPQWKVSESITIDLSGLKGADGADGLPGINGAGGDGQPGGPGKNGGNFFGKMFSASQEDLKRLTVNTSGGTGGYGGNGGAGAAGTDGVDGNLNQVTRTETYTYRHRAGGYWSNDDGSRNFYQAQGADGIVGQNGGRMGQGGFGGNQGMIHLDGPQNPNLVATQGTVGANGTPGQGGRGGIHGQHCNGEVLDYTNTQGHDNPRKRREINPGPTHVERPVLERQHTGPRGSAPNGLPGEGINDVGRRNPDEQTPFNPDLIVQDFGRNFEDAAANPIVVPFVKAFPGLGKRQ